MQLNGIVIVDPGQAIVVGPFALASLDWPIGKRSFSSQLVDGRGIDHDHVLIGYPLLGVPVDKIELELIAMVKHVLE